MNNSGKIRNMDNVIFGEDVTYAKELSTLVQLPLSLLRLLGLTVFSPWDLTQKRPQHLNMTTNFSLPL